MCALMFEIFGGQRVEWVMSACICRSHCFRFIQMVATHDFVQSFFMVRYICCSIAFTTDTSDKRYTTTFLSLRNVPFISQFTKNISSRTLAANVSISCNQTSLINLPCCTKCSIVLLRDVVLNCSSQAWQLLSHDRWKPYLFWKASSMSWISTVLAERLIYVWNYWESVSSFTRTFHGDLKKDVSEYRLIWNNLFFKHYYRRRGLWWRLVQLW